MPSNMLEADSRFPSLQPEKSVDDRFAEVRNYLFLLLEQLRYTLANLDAKNFNATGLQQITEPIYNRVEDAEGNISVLQQTASGLVSAVEDAEENISVLQQTAASLTFTIVQNDATIEYRLGANGATISASTRTELYSLSPALPPVGKIGGVIVNENGDPVLENGWYDTWQSSSAAVYACSTYDGGETWSAVYVKQGTVGQNGLTMLLSETAHVFQGTTSAARAATVNVFTLAYRDATRLPVTIGTITGAAAGMTATINDNGSTGAYVTVSVTTALTTEGALTIPITAGGVTAELTWNWSIAFKGAAGSDGSDASVTFARVNDVLGELFTKVSSGRPVEITGDGVYGPVIKGGTMYACKIYAGSGYGYAMMAENGLDVMDPGGNKKIGTGYQTDGNTTYPFVKLGIGSDSESSGAGLVYKLGAGLWIGDSAIAAEGGQYPGGESSVTSIAGTYPNATGIFIDLANDEIYKYINGVPSSLSAAVFS